MPSIRLFIVAWEGGLKAGQSVLVLAASGEIDFAVHALPLSEVETTWTRADSARRIVYIPRACSREGQRMSRHCGWVSWCAASMAEVV